MAPCPEIPTAFGYLKWALKTARENQLLREFAESYQWNRECGQDVFEAAWCALYDWDMADNSDRLWPRENLERIPWTR